MLLAKIFHSWNYFKKIWGNFYVSYVNLKWTYQFTFQQHVPVYSIFYLLLIYQASHWYKHLFWSERRRKNNQLCIGAHITSYFQDDFQIDMRGWFLNFFEVSSFFWIKHYYTKFNEKLKLSERHADIISLMVTTLEKNYQLFVFVILLFAGKFRQLREVSAHNLF